MRAASVCLRGSVCLYQGEELGLTEAYVAYEDLQDPYGIRFWPNYKGRDGCRTPIPWISDNQNGGFSDAKPWLPMAVEHLHRAVGIDLDIEEGEFCVFVGPSGCGKSTLLRMIAGLEEITGGTLEIDGMVVNDVPPAERGIAMVFQSYALYPHMTVRDNMAFGLKIAGDAEGGDRPRSRGGADKLQLDELSRPPAQGAVGRPAPARRHRPRHRARPQGLPVRRAAVEPRRRAARGDPDRDRAAARNRCPNRR
jgi:hypothetical protein